VLNLVLALLIGMLAGMILLLWLLHRRADLCLPRRHSSPRTRHGNAVKTAKMCC
jgi:hypothetical protein